MVTQLIIVVAVLMILHRLLTAADYFVGIPSACYRVAGYFSYAVTVFSIGLCVILKDDPIRILLIVFSVFWGIQTFLDYLDYKYYANENNAEESTEQNTEQNTEKEEQPEKKEGG